MARRRGKKIIPTSEKAFALSVVERLREAGHTALWAGGCVRDLLMGNEPSDYDVATSATPDQVRQLFGYRRTLPVGVSFGVVIVLGNRGQAEQVEVATFRTDAAYSDGRHPDAVVFSSPQEDAQRRDFTINGMFFDPLTQAVIDYVGGEADLQRGWLRAIGCADDRIGEDKLRMLRAVRFAARFGFEIEAATRKAIARHAAEVTCVSGERLWIEINKTLETSRAAWAVEQWFELGLLQHILPELYTHWPQQRAAANRLLASLTITRPADTTAGSSTNGIAQADWFDRLVALLWNATQDAAVENAVQSLKQRLKPSNEVRDMLRYCISAQCVLDDAPHRPWSQVQPLLIAPYAHRAVRLFEARVSLADAQRANEMRDTIAWLHRQLVLPAAELNPDPWVSGGDLIALGLEPSSRFRQLLGAARRMQLDRQLLDRPAALAWLRAQVGSSPGT
ncbi:MAG: CCA tRNA nucleotidyltransferase [Planctomycetales bacterium]|nr:CCA tRNA nucleotidyltransferase [Planctomycetales bacterium]MCA9183064.1 CCA tRNA nucleotidyltransferase [Planctomycetales bacterium]